MKKLLVLLLLLIPLARANALALADLKLSNFVTACSIPAKQPILKLSSAFVNTQGSTVAPTSCVGQVCYSWQTPQAGATAFNYTLYSSSLPIQINDSQKLSKNLQLTIQQSDSIKKDSANAVNAALEFLSTSFNTSKQLNNSQSSSISQQKSLEQNISTNTSALFHKYLATALQGDRQAKYPYCLSSAVNLFYNFYNNYESDKLVESYVIFRTIKPDELDFTNKHDTLNYAKFFYILQPTSQNAWAQATLFAELITQPEFADVKQQTDYYIDKVYKTYEQLQTQTTADILKTNKKLAAFKYNCDTTSDDKKVCYLLAAVQYNENAAAPNVSFSDTSLLNKHFINPLQPPLLKVQPQPQPPQPKHHSSKVFLIIIFLLLIALILIAVKKFKEVLK
jgi:hypothetical protein